MNKRASGVSSIWAWESVYYLIMYAYHCNYKYEESKGLLMSNLLKYVTAMFIPGLLGIIVATVLIIRICKNKNKIKE